MSQPFLLHQENPLNAETTLQVLCEHLITPLQHAFHRNHASLPAEEAVPGRIEVTCAASLPFELRHPSFDLTQFAEEDHRQVVAVLECAGNRRSELAMGDAKSEGLQWGAGTICNVEWQGVPVRKILASLLPAEAFASTDWAQHLHLHILSAQTGEHGRFAASLPLCDVLSHACPALLARTANDGTALPHAHDPRAVLPGKIGARWVKWVSELRIDHTPSDAEPMKEDYKIILPPHGDLQAAEERREELLHLAEPIMTLGVGSAIATPNDRARIAPGSLARGYAVPTDGRPITRVELIAIADDPNSSMEEIRNAAAARPASQWQRCELQTSPPAPADLGGATWGWTLWSVSIALQSEESGKTVAVVVRAATDEEEQERTSNFNLRGFGNRSWPVARYLQITEQVD